MYSYFFGGAQRRMYIEKNLCDSLLPLDTLYLLQFSTLRVLLAYNIEKGYELFLLWGGGKGGGSAIELEGRGKGCLEGRSIFLNPQYK